VLPDELRDTAFLDRIHAYLPGWEMPKIQPENYAIGYGFLTDYLAEIFAELRRRNFHTHVAASIELGSMTGRNQDAIKRMAAGLLKLLYPDRAPDALRRDEIAPIIEIAVEMRKRVTDQLGIISPAEFKEVAYTFRVKEGL
jgi:ATP-dependent Lon protease